MEGPPEDPGCRLPSPVLLTSHHRSGRPEVWVSPVHRIVSFEKSVGDGLSGTQVSRTSGERVVGSRSGGGGTGGTSGTWGVRVECCVSEVGP